MMLYIIAVVIVGFTAVQGRYVKTISTIKKEGGGVFTRWGRNECPPGNELVYSGYAGGSDFRSKGGPSTVLCMPAKPDYKGHTSGGQGGSYLYGAEYEPRQKSPNFKHLDDQDVICAVCRSREHKTTITIPARSKCFPGWQREYWGYLMGGRNDQGPSEYICVDNKPEGRVGGGVDYLAKDVFLVESVCGSLPCPPYHKYWELTCVVCSK